MTNFSFSTFNKSMFYLLILTIISSAFAYTIVIKAYDNLYEIEMSAQY